MLYDVSSVLQLQGQTWSTPAVAKIPNESITLVVACDREGNVSAFDGATCELMWFSNLSCVITSSPVIVDIDKGKLAVIVGGENGLLTAFNALNGDVIWSTVCGLSIRATVAVNQERKFLFIGVYGAWLHCISICTGEILWKKYLPKHEFFSGGKRGVVSSPLIADVDLDGELEVVTGMRSRRVFCLSATTGEYKWFREFNYDPDSSPSFAMVDGMPLVFIGGGEHTGGRGDNAVFALRGNDGGLHWKAKMGGGLDSSPIIADINGDGRLEVVITSLADASCYALDAATGHILWRYLFGPTEKCWHDENNICRQKGTDIYFTEDAVCRSYTTPLVSDLNHDGVLEVVVGSNNGQLAILNGETGDPVKLIETAGMVRGSPVLADINNDGFLELLVCSGDRVLVYQTESVGAEWPMYKGSYSHLGWLDPEATKKSDTRLRRQRFFWAKLIWYWLIKDFFRYLIFQFDRRVLRPFGLRIFDYYY